MYVFFVVFFFDILVCLLIFKECVLNIYKGFEIFVLVIRKYFIFNVFLKVVVFYELR